MSSLVLIGLLAIGCSGPDSDEAPELNQAGVGDSLRPDGVDLGPASLAEIAPGDTAGVLSLIRRIMREVDGSVRELTPRDTFVSAGEGLPDRELTYWKSGDQPLKLIATEPNRDDRIFPETIVWFSGGEVAVVSDEWSVYFFDAEELILLTDQSLVPIEASRERRSEIETEVLDSIAARIAFFANAEDEP